MAQRSDRRAAPPIDASRSCVASSTDPTGFRAGMFDVDAARRCSRCFRSSRASRAVLSQAAISPSICTSPLHLHAFIFLALSFGGGAASSRVRRCRSTSWRRHRACCSGVPIYAHLAFRRVYGGAHRRERLRRRSASARSTPSRRRFARSRPDGYWVSPFASVRRSAPSADRP